MHLYKPPFPYFAGDCMPFYQDGVFHLFYLLDENHHQGGGGLGGHQWAHATTTDLHSWQHHPLALPITNPDWEASICTGSVFWWEGVYYAFYATRLPDWTQHLCLATSADGIHFEKSSANPFLSAPPGYSPVDLRDPFVFADGKGGFHLLATSRLEPYALDDRGGCLLRLHSNDLRHWTVEGPLLVPGDGAGYLSVPECPDWFFWNGWYYLLYSQGLQTRYRMARQPLGPWQKPPVDLLDCPLAAVMKTAPLWDNRRLGVAFVGTRQGNRDSGAIQWAGNILFRELVQHPDGTLSTRFVPEMIKDHAPLALPPAAGDENQVWTTLTPGARNEGGCITLAAAESLEVAACDGLPEHYLLRCRVHPGPGSPRFGLGLRGAGRFGPHDALIFEPALRRVLLAEQSIEAVREIEAPFQLEVSVRGDILEACVGQSRCILNRLPEYKGARLFLFCEGGQAAFAEIKIFPAAWAG